VVNDGDESCASARARSDGKRRLKRLSVILWRGYDAESEVVRSLRSSCLCGAWSPFEFQRDMRSFEALFWVRNAVHMSLGWHSSSIFRPYGFREVTELKVPIPHKAIITFVYNCTLVFVVYYCTLIVSTVATMH
jgi:hypothetical protein